MEMLGGFACLFVGFCFEMALVMDRCLLGVCMCLNIILALIDF